MLDEKFLSGQGLLNTSDEVNFFDLIEKRKEKDSIFFSKK